MKSLSFVIGFSEKILSIMTCGGEMPKMFWPLSLFCGREVSLLTLRRTAALRSALKSSEEDHPSSATYDNCSEIRIPGGISMHFTLLPEGGYG